VNHIIKFEVVGKKNDAEISVGRDIG